MNQDQIDKLIQSIQAFSKCPTCSSQYEAAQIRLLEETANTCLLEMTCRKCGARALGTVLVHEPRMKNVPLALKTRKSAASLNSNQVIEFHQFLKNFDGDFCKLFNSSCRGKD